MIARKPFTSKATSLLLRVTRVSRSRWGRIDERSWRTCASETAICERAVAALELASSARRRACCSVSGAAARRGLLGAGGAAGYERQQREGERDSGAPLAALTNVMGFHLPAFPCSLRVWSGPA